MTGDDTIVFALMVFAAVVFLSQGLVIPAFGESRQARKRLKQRLDEIDKGMDDDTISSLLRKKYLRRLSPLEKRLESLPGMEQLRSMIEQAGKTTLAYRLVIASVLLGVLLGFVGWVASRMVIVGIVAGLAGLAIPYFRVMRARAERMARFEEQLPDAIDIVRRALMAGHPFGSTLKLVSDDMDDPVAHEFNLTFSDINYGNDVRRAMLGLLSRMPSVTVMALVTSVLVQKETGGNLAEILDQIAKVIRGRFRFQRRVRTLSAEGRMSAWVLAMVPLLLFAVMSITNPEYLPMMFEDPLGKQLIIFAFIWGAVGIFFIRRIIRIEV